MGNAYLERQRAVQQGMLDTGEELGMQKMWDYVAGEYGRSCVSAFTNEVI